MKKASIQEIMARARAVDDEIRRLGMGGPRALTFDVAHRAGWKILVSRDPSKPGRFRATTFDETDEPFGHAEATTFLDAIYTAHELGAVILRET